jgi:membrane-associated phospholipid phosphatase
LRTYSLNIYFIAPFIAWIIVGGILQLNFTQYTLFSSVNLYNSALLDHVMPIITLLGDAIGIITIGLIFLFVLKFKYWSDFLILLLCCTIPAIFTQILKQHFEYPRPLKVYELQNWVHHLPSWDFLYGNSFPSGHSTGAFSFFVTLSCMLGYRYKWLGSVFFLLALSTAYSRMYLAAHFFEDVYIGSIIGTIVAIVLLKLFNITVLRKLQVRS